MKADISSPEFSVAPFRRGSFGFTLVELLVVVGIIIIMMGLMMPAFNAIKGGGDLTKAAYDVAGALEGARAYAMANNTYTWVGFYEEDAGALAATNVKPPYTGKGRVILGIVAAKDGTTSCEDPAATAASPIPLTSTLVTQINKPVKIENVHLVDLGAPAASGDGKTLSSRPDAAYTNPGPPNDHYNRISSESADSTMYPVAAGNYTFYKTVRFNPRGESSLNSTYSPKRIAEIGLRPTHGSAVDNATANVVAIQLTGVGGKVNVYKP